MERNDYYRIQPGNKYRHYKGGEYIVLHLAQHTEDDEILVIYQSIHHGSYYARPVSSWLEPVKGNTELKGSSRFVEVIE